MFLLRNMMWGAQVILLSGHLAELGFTGREISDVLVTRSVARCVGLYWLVGWPDRYWPAEVFAGYSYLLCAPLLWWARRGLASWLVVKMTSKGRRADADADRPR